ncbi:MAG TPA: gamma carboxylase [Myxococcales bacterium]|nr:gamma carboxylase [Deltaproteobacteria bacterium]MBU54556.1 gamma carboxylase [Deltaproteobacteria bacterium]HAA55261.1 gamma carboxylase [Myxococcales bacterium]|tara:strand:- start:21335 stop:22726 length:1392 start_codon:yes stop_codon:yes gene_type:complete
METTPQQGWREYLLAPVDAASLVALRVLFGLLMFVGIVRFFLYDWIYKFYVRPSFHFDYFGFAWVKPWSETGLYIHFALLALLALCIALGLFYRWSVGLFLIGFLYVELLDKTYYLNHYVLVSYLCFLMLWLPLGRTASLDVWRGAVAPSSTVPRWCLWAMRLQIGLVYFFAGVAKLKSDWLLMGQPLHIWLSTFEYLPLVGPWMRTQFVALAFSWGGAIFDLTVVFFLLWRPTRIWAYLVVIVFHTITGSLFYIGMFPWMMTGFALIFFEPDWPKRLWTWWRSDVQTDTPAVEALPSVSQDRALRRFGFVVLGVFFAIQLALPLRHHLYPGNVCWREEGFRFAWHVMLIEKTGFVQFRLHDANSGKRWVLSPRQYLTPLQVKMMSTQPDMILTFAHELAARFRRKGYPGIEVYADAFASLNGRPRQRLLDPHVDLARQPRGWAPKRWIVPLQTSASAARRKS